MSYEKGSIPANRDRLGQWAFNQFSSVNTGFNQFRGFDFVKNGRLNKVSTLYHFTNFRYVMKWHSDYGEVIEKKSSVVYILQLNCLF